MREPKSQVRFGPILIFNLFLRIPGLINSALAFKTIITYNIELGELSYLKTSGITSKAIIKPVGNAGRIEQEVQAKWQ